MSITVSAEGSFQIKPSSLPGAAAVEILTMLAQQHPSVAIAIQHSRGANPDIETVLDTVFPDSDVTVADDGATRLHHGYADYSLTVVEAVLTALSRHVIPAGTVTLSESNHGWRQEYHFNGHGAEIRSGHASADNATTAPAPDTLSQTPTTVTVAVTTDVSVPAAIAADQAAVQRYLHDVLHFPHAEHIRLAA